MPSEEAFLRAVLADPDDDAPRLIYSDWLEEQGQGERAEFIRVQVALALIETEIAKCREDRLPHAWEFGGPFLGNVPAGRVDALRRRERELIEQDAPWFAVPGVRIIPCLNQNHHQPTGGGDVPAVIRRGFVQSVTCTAQDWLEHADAILACQPVREVRLTTPMQGWPSRWRLLPGRIGWWECDRWPRVKFTLPSLEGLNPGTPTCFQDQFFIP